LRQDYLESFRSLAGPQLPFSPWEGPTNDNTVEVELPLVKHYFPDSSLVALRVPPDESASFLGESLSRLGAEGGLLVVASTDLTHYGPAYAFAPAGLGPAGEKFRRQNDEKFIQAALSLDLPEILRLGNHQRAACSAGAAATAAFIARSLGLAGSLVDHYASADILPGDQSVGYAGIVYGGAAA
jgi:AmmeMemoRadiSam system protein B